ncbi:MAG: hypothetical protein ACOY4A_09700 [Pseudomonadota bacterium]|nr:hypothetical protein [Thermomonas sp. S9]
MPPHFEAQVEARGDELAAAFGLLRQKLAQVKEAARFDARAG